VIWGARINENYTGRARVTAIMTGVEQKWVFGGVYEEREEVIKSREAGMDGGRISDVIPIIRRQNV